LPGIVPGGLEEHLRAARAAGRKLLVPYVTGGIRDDWLDVLRALVAAGADAVEVGLPFSDPVMDGPTIQAASERALGRGTTPVSILHDLRDRDVGVPLVAMTYFNLIFRAGVERFATEARAAGVRGVIVPDIPLEELGEWEPAAHAARLETVLLASPVSPDARLAELCRRSQGFVYGVNLMGVTGERQSLGEQSAILARRLKAQGDLPVIMGFGVSSPDIARTIAAEADGVVVASAIMRRVLDGASPDEAGDFVATMRAALDRG
jgi:tryptophan synthase alpha chain